MPERDHNNPPEMIDPRLDGLTAEARLLTQEQALALSEGAKLADRLSKAVPGKVSPKAVKKLVQDIKQAKVIADGLTETLKARSEPGAAIIAAAKEKLDPVIRDLNAARTTALDTLDGLMKDAKLETVKTDYGSVASFNTGIEFETVDIAKVPAEYLMVDERKLKADMAKWDKAQEKLAKESDNPDDYAREPFGVPGVRFVPTRKAVVR